MKLNIKSQLKGLIQGRPAGRYVNHYESTSGFYGGSNKYYLCAAIDEESEWFPAPGCLGSVLACILVSNTDNLYWSIQSVDGIDVLSELERLSPNLHKTLSYAMEHGEPLL